LVVSSHLLIGRHGFHKGTEELLARGRVCHPFGVPLDAYDKALAPLDGLGDVVIRPRDPSDPLADAIDGLMVGAVHLEARLVQNMGEATGRVQIDCVPYVLPGAAMNQRASAFGRDVSDQETPEHGRYGLRPAADAKDRETARDSRSAEVQLEVVALTIYIAQQVRRAGR
jgi:hypothetical protein